MKDLVTLTIDGREFQAEEGRTILEVARDNGIEIPALCYNEGVEPYGACRLCLVEISKNRRTRLVTSCLYPIEEGLVVNTASERVVANRKMLMELLLARCSGVKVIEDLARKIGVEKPSFKPEYLEKNECILCGLCVRACREVVGTSAISLANRGVNREVAAPFLETAPDCIGCGSCVFICPTKCIKMEDKGDIRTIHNWKVDFKLKKCKVCGNYFAPEKQLEYIRKKLDLPEDFFDTCPNCK
jgi:NADH dehydrogenase/NADH:ubiquinone oxidoreductase subunit G